MSTDVSGLSVSDILADVPADTTGITVTGDPVNTTKVAVWKAEAEARAALLLRGQRIEPLALSADAVLYAGMFVKAYVIAKVLRRLRLFDEADTYAQEARDLEEVLKLYEEQLDSPQAGASRVNSNVDTSRTARRWGRDFTGF